MKSLIWLEEQKNISIPLVLTGAKASGAEKVLKFIEENKLSNVYYIGKVPFEDIISLYKRARFLISASLHESSCLPVLEAAASGVPIITSDIPPNVEMSKDILMNIFPATDHAFLGNMIADLLTKTDVLSNQINHNRISIENYSWKKIAKKYLDFFEKIKL